MEIKLVKHKITRQDLTCIASGNYGSMVKGVVDLGRNILALGGELHADAEAVLLQDGAQPQDLWGFNIYLDKPDVERVEYTSLINIRPGLGNKSIEIQDPGLRTRVLTVINALIE